ncbi:DoxX family protein [Enemella dayhoffiae]|uniref:DoxX family protein n=1 Tax=Enemella dayhoffiae TaxID=2016507 RepID=A0A255H0R2_9ACTN|nr:MauE/DoxX family redox-associated membrane protein [Enemella dayhoffiae]OYO20966.1 DoxX family protein [Enemella dayhoffiae]
MDEAEAPTAPRARRSISGWIGLAARVVLAVVWLWASLAKLPHLEESVLAVRGYQLLPYPVAVLVGYLLPMLELVVGILLILGLFTRFAGIMSALLMLAFVIGIAQAWARGLAIDCGCFGGGGEIALAEAQAKYPWELARDAALMLLGLWLAWRPRTPFSLDDKLFGEPAYATDDADFDDTAELEEEHLR